jgi:hypothetical protein
MKRKIIKFVFLFLMLSASFYLAYDLASQYQKRLMLATQIAKIESIETNPLMAPPPPPPMDGESQAPRAPTIIHVSPTDGLKVELQETTSWNTILQLVFTLLSTYLGLKLINRYVKE